MLPGMLVWYLGVFKALALNGMAFALYFMAFFTFPATITACYHLV